MREGRRGCEDGRISRDDLLVDTIEIVREPVPEWITLLLLSLLRDVHFIHKTYHTL